MYTSTYYVPIYVHLYHSSAGKEGGHNSSKIDRPIGIRSIFEELWPYYSILCECISVRIDNNLITA